MSGVRVSHLSCTLLSSSHTTLLSPALPLSVTQLLLPHSAFECILQKGELWMHLVLAMENTPSGFQLWGFPALKWLTQVFEGILGNTEGNKTQCRLQIDFS